MENIQYKFCLALYIYVGTYNLFKTEMKNFVHILFIRVKRKSIRRVLYMPLQKLLI